MSERIVTLLNLALGASCAQLTTDKDPNTSEDWHQLHVSSSSLQPAHQNFDTASKSKLDSLAIPVSILNQNHYDIWIPALPKSHADATQTANKAVTHKGNNVASSEAKTNHPPEPQNPPPAPPVPSELDLNRHASKIYYDRNTSVQPSNRLNKKNPELLGSVSKIKCDTRLGYPVTYVHSTGQDLFNLSQKNRSTVSLFNADNKGWMRAAWLDIISQMTTDALISNLRNCFASEGDQAINYAIDTLTTMAHQFKALGINGILVPSNASLLPPSLKNSFENQNEGAIFKNIGNSPVEFLIDTLTNKIVSNEYTLLKSVRDEDVNKQYSEIDHYLKKPSTDLPTNARKHALGLLYNFFGRHCNLLDQTYTEFDLLARLNSNQVFKVNSAKNNLEQVQSQISGENIIVMNIRKGFDEEDPTTHAIKLRLSKTPNPESSSVINDEPVSAGQKPTHKKQAALKEKDPGTTHAPLNPIDRREQRKLTRALKSFDYLTENELALIQKSQEKYEELKIQKPHAPEFTPKVFDINRSYFEAKTLPQLYIAVDKGFTFDGIEYPPQDFLVFVHEGKITNALGMIAQPLKNANSYFSSVLKSSQNGELIDVFKDDQDNPGIAYSEYFKKIHRGEGRFSDNDNYANNDHMTLHRVHIQRDELSKIVAFINTEIKHAFKNNDYHLKNIGSISGQRYMSAQMLQQLPKEFSDKDKPENFNLVDYVIDKAINRQTGQPIENISENIDTIVNARRKLNLASIYISDSNAKKIIYNKPQLLQLVLNTFKNFDQSKLENMSPLMLQEHLLKNPVWRELLTGKTNLRDAVISFNNDKDKTIKSSDYDHPVTLKAITLNFITNLKQFYLHLSKDDIQIMDMLEFQRHIRDEWTPVSAVKPVDESTLHKDAPRFKPTDYSIARLADFNKSNTLQNFAQNTPITEQLLTIQQRLVELRYHAEVHHIPANMKAKNVIHNLMNQIAQQVTEKRPRAKKFFTNFAVVSASKNGYLTLNHLLNDITQEQHDKTIGLSQGYAQFLKEHSDEFRENNTQLQMLDDIKNSAHDIWTSGLVNHYMEKLKIENILAVKDTNPNGNSLLAAYYQLGKTIPDIQQLESFYTRLKIRANLDVTAPGSLAFNMSLNETVYHDRYIEFVNLVEQYTALATSVISQIPETTFSSENKASILKNLAKNLKIPPSHQNPYELEQAYHYQYIAEYLQKSGITDYINASRYEALTINLQAIWKAKTNADKYTAFKNFFNSDVNINLLDIPQEIKNIILKHIELVMNVNSEGFSKEPETDMHRDGGQSKVNFISQLEQLNTHKTTYNRESKNEQRRFGTLANKILKKLHIFNKPSQKSHSQSSITAKIMRTFDRKDMSMRTNK